MDDTNAGVNLLMSRYESLREVLPHKRDEVMTYERRLRSVQDALTAVETEMSEIREVLEKLGFEPDAD